MYIKKAVVKENGAICVYSRDQKRNNKKGDVSSNMGECEVEWIACDVDDIDVNDDIEMR